MPVTPLPLRKVKAQMILKALDLYSVAQAAGVEYTIASRVLNGRLSDADALARLKKAIKEAKMPEEAAA